MKITFGETYRTACASTSNITLQDTQSLDRMLNQSCAMVAKRPTGYFIKLFEHENDSSNYYPNFSDDFNNLLLAAAQQGYQCLELDSAANKADNAPCFNW